MLQLNKRPPDQRTTFGEHDDEPVGGASLTESLKSFISIAVRQLPLFLVVMTCAMALGFLYLITTRPTYTGVAKMVIDSNKVQPFQQQQNSGESAIDNIGAATQVEVLMSDNVSLAVIKELKLTEDPEFVGPHDGLIGMIIDLISRVFESGEEQSESGLQRRALTAFGNHLKVSRVPQTYVMEIAFWSRDPVKAALIANSICEAYILDQLDAKYQSARRASRWLQDRADSLRTDATAASQALFEFKQKNNIVETDGKLMNEQEMSELNKQLVTAHAATAEAKARLDRIQQVMSQDVQDASVTDALKSEVIIKLRQQYLELATRESLWSKRYGPDHLATINLRNQMAEIRHNIADEMQKIAQGYKSDYEIALTHEASMQQRLGSDVAQSRITNQAKVQLNELESKVQTSRTMYDNFLQRYLDAVQQQSFPVSEARLITPATPPRSKSHPKILIVLLVSASGGIIVAFGAALLREASDHVFRTGDQVEEVLHVSCLAVLPVLKCAAFIATPERDEETVPLGQKRSIARADSLLRFVVDAPLSQFTELLRSVKVVADLKGAMKAHRVIGVASTLPNEGKSTVAANFAAMIAGAGSRVILVDGDLRNPSLSRNLAPGSSAGLLEVAGGGTALDDAVWMDPASGLTFLPAGPQATKVLHPNEILVSDAVKSLIDNLRDVFDYVIVDVAPLAPVADTRTTTRFVDSYVYVIEWGRTDVDIVKHSLFNAPEIYDRLLGVVLNKANMSIIRRLEPHRTSYYYKDYYRHSDVA